MAFEKEALEVWVLSILEVLELFLLEEQEG